MSNVAEDEPPDYVADDQTDLGHAASDLRERLTALQWCLDSVWINKNIGRLERVDSDGSHGWKMWKWKP